ncbi:MAG: flagellar export protein FliJ [Treponema sp.]|jgi:flagellar FliJ protein|nr:flagellar export protein FliJ [Treponema sp.]
MKRFAFSLEKILSLREFAEKDARLALGRAVAEGARIRNEIADTAHRRYLAAQSLSGVIKVNDLSAIQNYLFRLDVRRDTLLLELAQAERVIAEKRTAFAEAMKNRRALTNLREKKFAAWRKEREREESLVLDEIGNRGIAS